MRQTVVWKLLPGSSGVNEDVVLEADPGVVVESPPSSEERERLLAEFLASPEGQHWRGDEDAQDVVRTAIWFGTDCNHGGPVRWSVVVVEIFMTSWLPCKVTREPVFFERVTDVLPDWVALCRPRPWRARRTTQRGSPSRRAVAGRDDRSGQRSGSLGPG